MMKMLHNSGISFDDNDADPDYVFYQQTEEEDEEFETEYSVLMKASSTLAAVLAEVSMNTNPCSRANASPSSRFTSRRESRSLWMKVQSKMLEEVCT
ncbi:hypothetical protein E2C01_013323 [Portunus trituberculatus]|uniref:Uncharacterized protein n=1 Tax=Portunus trituberculatus TaxID=210409 RepID=A0A5B7DFW3_PORTR|nr:hypothetical protein [Portunus trituberculatus]